MTRNLWHKQKHLFIFDPSIGKRSNHRSVCSKHFKPDCFTSNTSSTGRRLLHKEAVPTLFNVPWPDILQEYPVPLDTSSKKLPLLEMPSIFLDHNYSLPADPELYGRNYVLIATRTNQKSEDIKASGDLLKEPQPIAEVLNKEKQFKFNGSLSQASGAPEAAIPMGSRVRKAPKVLPTAKILQEKGAIDSSTMDDDDDDLFEKADSSISVTVKKEPQYELEDPLDQVMMPDSGLFSMSSISESEERMEDPLRLSNDYLEVVMNDEECPSVLGINTLNPIPESEGHVSACSWYQSPEAGATRALFRLDDTPGGTVGDQNGAEALAVDDNSPLDIDIKEEQLE